MRQNLDQQCNGIHNQSLDSYGNQRLVMVHILVHIFGGVVWRICGTENVHLYSYIHLLLFNIMFAPNIINTQITKTNCVHYIVYKIMLKNRVHQLHFYIGWF